MIANPTIEQMSREDMSALQLKKLKKQMHWAMEKSAFYYKKFTGQGLNGQSIQSLEDLQKLPLTTSEEIDGTTVYNLLTLPLSAVLRISRIGFSKPVIKMYTNGDLAYQIEGITDLRDESDRNGMHESILQKRAKSSEFMKANARAGSR